MILHYSGKWLDDLMDGHGIEMKHGDIWEGEWHEDNKNGVFKHKYMDGRCETLRYINGMLPPLSKCKRKQTNAKADDADYHSSVHRILKKIDDKWYMYRDEENEIMRNERMLFLAQELINKNFPFSISVIDLGKIAMQLEKQYKSQQIAERELLAYEAKKLEDNVAKKVNKRERLEREREERKQLKNERREKERSKRERIVIELKRIEVEKERLIIEKAKQDEAAALKKEHENSKREAKEEKDRELKLVQYIEANNVLELENKSIKFASLEKSRKIAAMKSEIALLEEEVTADAHKVAKNNLIISLNNEQVAKIDKKLCIVCFLVYFVLMII